MEPTAPILLTWVREKDAPAFAAWWPPASRLEVRDARTRDPARRADEDLATMDGLLLTGGPDLAAEFLRQPVPDPGLVRDPDPVRDRWELAALRAALARGVPVLAVCKGHQVLNVALGGSLHLDVPGHDEPTGRRADRQELRHADAVPASRRFARVNSSHHQAVDRLGDGLQAEAWCAADGLVEQVRLRGYPAGCLGVQYHPEHGPQYAPLWADFLGRVTARAGRSPGAGPRPLSPRCR